MALSRLLGFLFGWSPEPTSDLPVLYTWKIDRISSISKFGMSHCASRDFSAGGYTWKLILSCLGIETDNEKNYMSLNLFLVDACSLASDLDVKAVFELCIHNQVSGEHIREKAEYYFKANRDKWGPYNFSFEAVDTPSGFCINDSCIFSIEIINVVVRRQIVEHLSLQEEAQRYKYTYKINNLSKLEIQRCVSEHFVAGSHQWYLAFHPRRKWGNEWGNEYYVSLFLHMYCHKILPANVGVCVQVFFRMIDQINGNNHEIEGYCHFDVKNLGCGFATFLPLNDLYNPSKGFLLKDSCIIEAVLCDVGVAIVED
uniref:Ubiquitin carboxyl-terminal hydrolase 12 n=1 Tax=Anthurium amnicola TaxID=1678845 RepID=A0A1D1Z806_9ARAE